MLISYQHQFIFIHILKTAGTSVAETLAPHARLMDSLIYGNWPTRKFFMAFNILTGRRGIEMLTGFRPHATAMDIRQKIPGTVFDEFFKFAFVRNPWDWCVSLFFYLQQNKNLPPHRQVQGMTFSDFVQWRIGTSPKKQIEFITNWKGDIIVDYIGRYENVESDFKYICKKLGLRESYLPNKNISRMRKNRNYRTYYDTQTAELVSQYFHEDISAFGYQFD